MTDSEPLFWADFLIESHLAQCATCGAIEPEDDLVNVQLDEPGCWERVCKECKERLLST